MSAFCAIGGATADQYKARRVRLFSHPCHAPHTGTQSKPVLEAQMHIEVDRQLRAAHEPLSIVVADDIWDLYVFGDTRVQHDWWVQIAVVGPRSCTVTVRVDAAQGR